MNKEQKQQKIQAIADVIQNLLLQVDIFTQVLSKEDFEILEKTKSSLKDTINYKQSASVLLYEIGADADTAEDEMKLKTLDLLVDLIKARIEFKEKKLKLQEKQRNKQEAINLFKSMGII